jgi:hypothetical protein
MPSSPLRTAARHWRFSLNGEFRENDRGIGIGIGTAAGAVLAYLGLKLTEVVDSLGS